MRLLYTLFTLAIGGYGLFWIAEKNPDWKTKAEELIDFRKTNSLETRFSASQIMETHQKKLLKEKGTRYLDPELKFFPHLLLTVKYCDKKKKSKEGLILWDLTDGEMILDTKSWEKTHGFADCILNKAHPQEFKILRILSDKGGSCDSGTLLDILEYEMTKLEILLRSCLNKNLIIQTSFDHYRLHLEQPKLTSIPETKIHEQLTTRPHKKALRAKSHFSRSQVERLIKFAFGENFSIRTTTEIYLPIHRIVTQKPDGSMHTSHFNALTGKELPPASFYE